ncbi:subtilisin-like protein [Daldinia loculata]|uniref:subtilisin-like protein n=1 Tax=Daldinia loculata TaxID=103429 RepID=UPI0020C51200|nr:subtilisin-like protein [Daldinia loculata]KAI1650417.1 subtilisin-like protein [Daldinia loculata]KAI2783371.1 subtilisin-like protein [Daldinia loculata]
MPRLARLALAIFGLAVPALAKKVDILSLQDGDEVPGRYIVSLKPDIDIGVHLDWVLNVRKRSLSPCSTNGPEKTYGFKGFNGYAGEFDEKTIAQIMANENVLAVEPDRVARLTSVTQQTNAPWGIASLSSRSQLANDNSRGHTYSYSDCAGTGTYAYVLDSGVLTNNSEFGGRAIKGYNTYAGTESFDDHFGHGTHVAGTVASATYGVAKNATVVDVKVVRGPGYSTTSHVIDGINWAVNNITSTPGRASKSVINMSLAFTTSSALNNAVNAASLLGILSVVSAGNDGADASTRSPASAGSALTVGAVGWDRTRASWSNFGRDVDIFAPGVDVPSLWNVEGLETLNSGTSMASPHVAGLALYLKALEEGLDSPAKTVARIKELAIRDVVIDAGSDSPNLLAYNGIA